MSYWLHDYRMIGSWNLFQRKTSQYSRNVPDAAATKHLLNYELRLKLMITIN